MRRPEWFLHSFIDVPAWDAARWKGTGFMYKPDLSIPPQMALLYTDGEAGRRIFRAWRERIGARDEYEELRVSIIEGDIPGQDSGYSVHISANLENVLRRARAAGHELKPEMMFTLSRIHRMNPEPGSRHLAMFKKSFERHGVYELMPAGMGPGGSLVLTPELAITKRQVLFRRVAEIGPRDLDVVVLEGPRDAHQDGSP